MADFCKGHCTMLLYEATCNDIKLLKIYHILEIMQITQLSPSKQLICRLR